MIFSIKSKINKAEINIIHIKYTKIKDRRFDILNILLCVDQFIKV